MTEDIGAVASFNAEHINIGVGRQGKYRVLRFTAREEALDLLARYWGPESSLNFSILSAGADKIRLKIYPSNIGNKFDMKLLSGDGGRVSRLYKSVQWTLDKSTLRRLGRSVVNKGRTKIISIDETGVVLEMPTTMTPNKTRSQPKAGRRPTGKETVSKSLQNDPVTHGKLEEHPLDAVRRLQEELKNAVDRAQKRGFKIGYTPAKISIEA